MSTPALPAAPRRAELSAPFTLRSCASAEWPVLRSLRLAMLTADPHAFDTSLLETTARPDQYWRDWAARAAAGTELTAQLAWAGELPVGMAAAHLEQLEHLAHPGQLAPLDDSVISDPRAASVAHAGALWVVPSYRNRGVARALWEALEHWARSCGATRIELGVAEWNLEARRRYEAWGYRPNGVRHTTRWGHAELHLTKPLEDPASSR